MSLATFLGPGVRMKTSNESTALRIGADILNWQQEEQNERDRNTLLSMLEGPGLFVSRDPTGQLGGEWLPYEDPDNAGYLLVGYLGNSGEYTHQQFIDSSGYRVVAATELTPVTSWAAPYADTLQVPTDSTWRTLVVRRAATQYAPGKITFTNTSATIAGVGTDLTRFAASTTNGLALGTRIRVDTADNATLAGTYYLATVTSATAGTLTTNAPGTATVPFAVVGTYLGTEPATNANKDIYQRIVPKFELVSRTVAPTAGDLILADVWYDGATMKIRDRRQANLASWRDGLFSPSSVPALISNFDIDTSSTFTGVTLQEWQISTADGGQGDVAVAFRQTSGSELLLLRVVLTTAALGAYRYRPLQGTAGKGTESSLATVFATGNNSRPTLLHLRVGNASSSDDSTHLAGYINSGKLFIKTSDDEGATWTGGGAATWDPTAVDASDTLSDPFFYELRNGRVLCIGVYFDDSASTYSVRAIYSDDAGTTWSTNSNAGTVLGSSSGSSVVKNPCIIQDIRNGRIFLAYEEETAGIPHIEIEWSDTESGIADYSGNLVSGDIAAAMDNSTPSGQAEPALWIGPSGHLVVLYAERLAGASGFVDLRYSVLGVKDTGTIYELYNEHIQRIVDAATFTADITSAERLRPAVMQSPSGLLYCFYTRPTATVDIYQLKTFKPVAMPLTASPLSS